jgi:hypothetical protein
LRVRLQRSLSLANRALRQPKALGNFFCSVPVQCADRKTRCADRLAATRQRFFTREVRLLELRQHLTSD